MWSISSRNMKWTFLKILNMGSASIKNMRWELGNMGSISIKKHEMISWNFEPLKRRNGETKKPKHFDTFYFQWTNPPLPQHTDFHPFIVWRFYKIVRSDDLGRWSNERSSASMRSIGYMLWCDDLARYNEQEIESRESMFCVSWSNGLIRRFDSMSCPDASSRCSDEMYMVLDAQRTTVCSSERGKIVQPFKNIMHLAAHGGQLSSEL